MAIVWDDGNKRVTDTETGEYLNCERKPFNMGSGEHSFGILSKDDRPLFAGRFYARGRFDAAVDSGIDWKGGVNIVRYVVTRAWIPPEVPGGPNGEVVDQSWFPKLEAFLRAWHPMRQPHLENQAHFELEVSLGHRGF